MKAAWFMLIGRSDRTPEPESKPRGGLTAVRAFYNGRERLFKLQCRRGYHAIATTIDNGPQAFALLTGSDILPQDHDALVDFMRSPQPPSDFASPPDGAVEA